MIEPLPRSHAERTVRQHLRAALEDAWRLYPNVRWLAATRPGGPARDGETDVVLVHPQRGILVVEVKGGAHITRDHFGRWYSNGHLLEPPPFKQAEDGKRVLAAKIADHPRWVGDPPRLFHAVAFPDVDRASLGSLHDAGPDAPAELILDRTDLAKPEATRAAIERICAYWVGDGARDRPLSEAAMALIDGVFRPQVELRALVRGDIDEGDRDLVEPTHHQLRTLISLHHARRAAVQGCAGSGKTLLALAKTRELASQGQRVLLVCFNQPLARTLARSGDLAALEAADRVTVSTFHELCRRLGTEAGVLGPTPDEPDQHWWNEDLPNALDRALPVVGGRYGAVVVDEGQDFEAAWMLSLDGLLAAPGVDDFYVFYDPWQALIARVDPFGSDCIAALGLTAFDLPDNCRNARPIHELAYRFYRGDLLVEPLRSDGDPPEIIEAEPGEPTLDALRDVLHALTVTEQVDRAEIAVLCGVSLERSAIWHREHHRFGGVTLWNGNLDDRGKSLRLAADQVPPQPAKTVLCDSIARFKGLDRAVVILVELNPHDPHLERLLYVGLSRALHHIVVIAPPELAHRLRTMSA